MCVGLPARVVSINEGTAIIDANGAKRSVASQLIDDLEPGDYVMVHAGVAIAKINSDDETEGNEILGII
ncbi:MAG: HypC/HybG/HupF family hydrogenase formation chaperone [Lachnospiraceae bacterium]|nr:HypC/HybG/HupF family hydrogenase formation chaperone [Lachnospiraceae bacterium]